MPLANIGMAQYLWHIMGGRRMSRDQSYKRPCHKGAIQANNQGRLMRHSEKPAKAWQAQNCNSRRTEWGWLGPHPVSKRQMTSYLNICVLSTTQKQMTPHKKAKRKCTVLFDRCDRLFFERDTLLQEVSWESGGEALFPPNRYLEFFEYLNFSDILYVNNNKNPK